MGFLEAEVGGGVVLEHGGGPDVAVQGLEAFVPGLAHDRAVGGAVLRGGGGVPGAQGVPGEPVGRDPGGAGGALDDLGGFGQFDWDGTAAPHGGYSSSLTAQNPRSVN